MTDLYAKRQALIAKYAKTRSYEVLYRLRAVTEAILNAEARHG